MAHNPRYSRWTDENWQAYAPTIGHMDDQRWALWAVCPACGLAIDLKSELLIKRRGRAWSPWGVTSPCVRRGCHARMYWRAGNGRAERDIWLSG